MSKSTRTKRVKNKGTKNKGTKNKGTKNKGTKKNKRIYTKNHYSSGDGMLTTVWGPSMWHCLHTMSFNYPISPTNKDKRNYRNFILNLQNVLPCKYCRINLKKNFKIHPLNFSDMKNRESFSKYIYRLHEIINRMLGKKSGLSYCDVRERYEHFRSRCTIENTSLIKNNKSIKKYIKLNNRKDKKTQKKHKKTIEKGCTEPLYGKKSKCIIKIVPQEEKCKTMQIDKECLKKKI